MLIPERTIFRKDAIKYYTLHRDKDILPQFISIPVITFLWLLLAVFAVTGILAWCTYVPTYATGTGMILTQDRAIAFFPPSTALHAGQSAQIHIGTAGLRLQCQIIGIEPSLISPALARQRYSDIGAALITQPSLVVTLKLSKAISSKIYAGSSLSVHAHIGSRRMIALLPGLETLIGGW